jgi:hypothetical protein
MFKQSSRLWGSRMFGDREEMRRPLYGLIERFRQRGATSPEKAMTLQELGLPRRFEEAMHRRLGQSGIFVEVDGGYYLDEERLRQIREERARAGFGGGDRERPASWFRYFGILLMLPIGLIIVAVLLFYFIDLNGQEYFPGETLVIIVIVFIGLFVARMLFLRANRRYWRELWMQY